METDIYFTTYDTNESVTAFYRLVPRRECGLDISLRTDKGHKGSLVIDTIMVFLVGLALVEVRYVWMDFRNMQTAYWLVFIVIANFHAVWCKAVPSHVTGSQTLQRRFLYDGNFCNGLTCVITCFNGYEKSDTGCDLCRCRTAAVSKPDFLPSNFSTNAGTVGVFFERPCDPSVRHCPLKCNFGYATGTSGCQLCACLDSSSATTVTTSFNTTSLTQSTTKTTTTYVSTTATTSTTITSSVTSHGITKPKSGYIDPCIPTQIVCRLDCGNSYVLGPEGCQYCLCAATLPANLRPTTATFSRPGFPKLDPPSTTAAPIPSPEACILAKVICSGKCQHGFISKPADCLYCACIQPRAGHAATTVSHLHLKLRKPCLYGNTLRCNAKCMSGFIRGPRNCQFCSCR